MLLTKYNYLSSNILKEVVWSPGRLPQWLLRGGSSGEEFLQGIDRRFCPAVGQHRLNNKKMQHINFLYFSVVLVNS